MDAGARKKQRKTKEEREEANRERCQEGVLQWEPSVAAASRESLGTLGRASIPREARKAPTKLLNRRASGQSTMGDNMMASRTHLLQGTQIVPRSSMRTLKSGE